ncbi:MAG: O-acetylhomoserine aminocarboxypropyltransferase/cysteine synthase [Clostridia bacterium]|nr:O-acetylhomoserine aminocarboxypropyltransferase/cysteine synthase [Clostridia bacterium]
MKEFKNETKCLHSGYEGTNGNPRAIPIIQSTTFKYDSSEDMADLFDLKTNGYFYSRLANPTNDYVAQKIADLEGGVGAVLTSSGQAASFYSIFNICQSGDHIVSSSAIYGGTFNLFAVTMKKMGIDFTFVSPDATEDELNNAFRENTKAVFAETLANPALVVTDIEKFAKIAHAHKVPLIIDNTFATPILCKPIDFGADIVIHSTTKYMDGHGLCVGGVVVDSGNFDWEKSGKYPCLTEPDESYHGLTYTETFKNAAYITKMVAQLMRDLGSIPSPHNSFLLNIGLETLHLRIQRHYENAIKIAKHLEHNEKIEWIRCPALESDKNYDLAKKYLSGKSCGVISFGIKGGKEKSVEFINKLNLIAIATHVADAKSCVLHPASSTHRQLTDEQLDKAGIPNNLIRLSVGIENVDDIIADIDQALSSI